MPKSMSQQTPRRPWLIIVAVLALLTAFSFGVVGCVALLVTDDEISGGNVAVIPIKGIIVVDGDSSIFGSTGYAISEDIVKAIKKAEDNVMIQGIILDINSPGGSPVASAEIARAVSEAKKPTVAVIREVGASGAYWVAASADYVIANEVSVTGSIGVFASYLQYGELLNRFNVTYERFVAGEHKDMGSPYRKMTTEEKARYQHVLDIMYKVFVREVAKGRNLDADYIQGLATGEIYLGIEAIDLGLIDALGGRQEGYAYLENQLGIEVLPIEYDTKKGFIEMLVGAIDRSAFHVGTGIGSVLVADQDSGIIV